MAVRIRLSRIGKKHVPFFRVVAVDSRRKRDGAILANIGTYDGLNSKVILFHEDLYQEWIAKGALPTDSAKKIYRLFKKGAQAPEKVKKVKEAAIAKPKVEEEPAKKVVEVKETVLEEKKAAKTTKEASEKKD